MKSGQISASAVSSVIPSDTPAPREIRLASEGRAVRVFSDIHLSPLAPFGLPTDRDELLARSLTNAVRRNEILVLAGDIVDYAQERTEPGTVWARFPAVRRALESTSRTGAIYYVIGNHDPPIEESRAWIDCPACDHIILDGHTLIIHGHQYDAYVGDRRDTPLERAHALIQRVLRAELQFPFDEFGSLTNRAYQGLGAVFLAAALRIGRALGRPRWHDALAQFLDYLLHQELRMDPMWMLRGIRDAKLPGEITRIVCGHSHLPGLAVVDGRLYTNAGSWSRHHATTARLHGPIPHIHDHANHKTYGFEVYRRWRLTADWYRWYHERAIHLWPSSLLQASLSSFLELITFRLLPSPRPPKTVDWQQWYSELAILATHLWPSSRMQRSLSILLESITFGLLPPPRPSTRISHFSIATE